MIQHPGRSRFLLEATHAFGIGGECRRQNFHSYFTAQPGIAGAIHLPYPARAERSGDLVGAEAGAGRQWHEARFWHRESTGSTEKNTVCEGPGTPGAGNGNNSFAFSWTIAHIQPDERRIKGRLRTG
jgi:hypothetical protein